MTQIRRIALIIAMQGEAQPLIDALSLREDTSFGDPVLPFRFFKGSYTSAEAGRSFELLLSVNGKDPRFDVDNIGTAPAALNAHVSLNRFKPDLCINVGTAGGFKKRGGEIGDVYLSDRPFRFHDRRIPIPGGFADYGVGSYPSVRLSAMARELGLKEGAVTTGDALDYTDKCLEIMDQHEGAAKEMEAASIAWVAWLYGIPFFALKSITDIVDGGHPTHEEFLRNFAQASRALQSKTLAVLSYLARHPDPLA